MPLNPRQQRFVAEYLVDCNATQAAIRAGYSAKTANRIGPALLSNVGVKQAVETGKAKVCKKLELTQEWVIEQLRYNVDFSREIGQAAASNGALHLLGKHLSLFVDRVDLTSGGEKLGYAAFQQIVVDGGRDADRGPT